MKNKILKPAQAILRRELAMARPKNLVVWDIDDCLLDSTARKKWVETKNWGQYFAEWATDVAIPQGVVLCRSFINSPHYRNVFITARSEQSRASTLHQLQHFVSPSIDSGMLHMRPDGVFDSKAVAPDGAEILPDTELKLKLLFEAGYVTEEVFFMYEDRTSTAEAWRARGVMVIQPQLSMY